MKTFLNIILTAALFAMSGCTAYNDDPVWDELYNLNREQQEQADRLAALEAWQTIVNNNITALQALVVASQGYRYITEVAEFSTPAPGGYTINFSSGAPITVYNGAKGDKGDAGDKGDTGDKGDKGDDGDKGDTGDKGDKGDKGDTGDKGDKGDDGDDGSTPLIGVAKDTDNIYYWTLDGEFLTDSSGNKIPVTGPKGDKGDNGDNGNDGQDGQDGADGQDGQDGADGQDGQDGADGQDGQDGADGQDGQDGADGITPQLRINTVTNYWEICTNGTCTSESDWTSTSVTATGSNGATGATGAQGPQGPQGDAIFAENGIDNSNADYVEFTLADGSTTIQVLKYRPLSITFTQPAAFTNGESRDISFTVIGGAQSVTAVDVPRGWTVVPNVATTEIVVTAPAAAARYTAAGTVTLLVSDGAERTVAQPLVLECPAYVPPAELGISFTQPQLFASGHPREVGFTTTGNATAVKVVDVPAGWTVTVTKQGNAGTFTITAPDVAAYGEAIVFVSDDAGKTAMRTLILSVGLVNAKQPFAVVTGSGKMDADASSDKVYRLWKLDGWKCSDEVLVNVDLHSAYNPGHIVMFSHPPGDIPWVSNAKVYQEVHLEAGSYEVVFHVNGCSPGVEAYGVVTTDTEVPDLSAVVSSSVIAYDELTKDGYSSPSDFTIPFTLSAAANVTIGWVYKTFETDIPSCTPSGTDTCKNNFASLNMTGVELLKK